MGKSQFTQMIQDLVDFLTIHKDKFDQPDLEDFVHLAQDITEQGKVDCLAAFFVGVQMGQTVEYERDAIVEDCGKILDGTLTYTDSQADIFSTITKQYGGDEDEEDAQETARWVMENSRDIEKLIASLIIETEDEHENR